LYFYNQINLISYKLINHRRVYAFLRKLLEKKNTSIYQEELQEKYDLLNYVIMLHHKCHKPTYQCNLSLSKRPKYVKYLVIYNIYIYITKFFYTPT